MQHDLHSSNRACPLFFAAKLNIVGISSSKYISSALLFELMRPAF